MLADLLNKGAKLVGLVRQATAVVAERIQLRAGTGVVAYDLLKDRSFSGDRLAFTLGAGEVKVVAVLPQAPGAPQLRVTGGRWRAGEAVQVAIRVPNAPEWSAVRVEVQHRRGKPLPKLSQNLLLRNGQATLSLNLPYNPPEGSWLAVRHVSTGQQTSLFVSP